jgi:hypothetical protein
MCGYSAVCRAPRKLEKHSFNNSISTDSLVKQFKETPLIVSPNNSPDPELDQSTSHSKMSDPF